MKPFQQQDERSDEAAKPGTQESNTRVEKMNRCSLLKQRCNQHLLQSLPIGIDSAREIPCAQQHPLEAPDLCLEILKSVIGLRGASTELTPNASVPIVRA